MKMGRRALPEQDLRADTLKIRVNAVERLSLNHAAKIRGLKLSAWIRDTLLKAARRKKATGKPQSSPMRISPQSVRRAIVSSPAPAARAEGVKPKWWGTLVEDTKSCPGKAPA